MKTREELLEVLIKIKDDINRQIPFISNRFDEYECAPRDADLDKIDQERKANEAAYSAAQLEYLIFREVTHTINLYLQECGLADRQQLSKDQLKRIEEKIIHDATKISRSIERVKRIILTVHKEEKVPRFDHEQVEQYLRQNSAKLVSEWFKTGHLSIRNPKFDRRCQLSSVLLQHRENCESQFQLQRVAVEKSDTHKHWKDLIKAKNFWTGLYFDRIQSFVGNCDEHTCLGLLKIFSDYHIWHGIRVEQIGITYLDENNQPDDGHTFLAINRHPDAPLNKISEWGPDAILFDPWNKLVCFAKDLDKQPLHYFSYDEKAEWKSLEYGQEDHEFLNGLCRLEDYYITSGNSDMSVREQRIIEEFQLTPIHAPALQQTCQFLQGIIKSVWPEHLKKTVRFYIALEGNNLVSSLPGMVEPVIIIHQHFLTGTLSGNADYRGYSEDQLRFALARELLYVTYYDANISARLMADDDYILDRKAIEKTTCGKAAIKYLQNEIVVNSSYPKAMKLPTLKDGFLLEKLGASMDKRVKMIMAFLAENEHLAGGSESKALPATIIPEARALVRQQFYTAKFASFTDRVAQLDYLKSELQDLHIELLPYEYCGTPSIRVREFCSLLRNLKIDLDNPEECAAAHAIIYDAYRCRVPAFIRLYYALLGARDVIGYKDAEPLPALGIFKDYQITLAAFLNASEYDVAKQAAKKLLQYQHELKDHFIMGISGFSAKHLEAYRAKHKRPPTGIDRYFGSWIGLSTEDMRLKDFDHTLIDRGKHLEWVKEDKENDIAHVLWMLGLRDQVAIWDCFSSEQLIDLIDNDDNQKNIAGKTEFYAQKTSRAVKTIQFISQRHELDTTMFQHEDDFESAYMKFMQANWPMLMTPRAYFKLNHDNVATDFLLTKFVEVALSGTVDSKNTAKNFFLGRADRLDLLGLRNFMKKLHISDLINGDVYSEFVLSQEYKGKFFQLFTLDEQIMFMNQHLSLYHNITPLQIFSMFGLSYEKVSLESLHHVIPLLNQKQNMELNWMLVDRLLQIYKDENDLPPLFSTSGAEFVSLSAYMKRMGRRKAFLSGFTLNLPDSISQWHDLNCDSLIKIYQAFDVNLLFPDVQIKQQFGRLLFEKIQCIDDVDCRIKTVESWLFNQTFPLFDVSNIKHYPPISDIAMRNRLVEMYVTDLLTKYGKDDGTEDYALIFKKVIDNLFSIANNRDLLYSLAKLTVAIESQASISEYAGINIDPDKYKAFKDKSHNRDAIQQLAVLCQITAILSRDADLRERTIDFLASPLTDQSLNSLAQFLLSKIEANELMVLLTHESMNPNEEELRGILHSTYYRFWSLTQRERAIMMESLIIPSTCTATEERKLAAYQEGVKFVSKKLFPNKDKDPDEQFADAFINAYMLAANEYLRPYLMAGLLVAANESEQLEHASAGKKLALFCENMGPAYVKLAQAIHSHPRTPDNIRKDLSHIKGRANPPYRWDLWLLIDNVVPRSERDKIKRVGELLGSASYNLALEVTLKTGDEVVLLLLRENAETEARKGFAHLRKTILHCDHARMGAIRETALSILDEAEKLSAAEMDHKLSAKQAEIAKKMYSVKTSAYFCGNLYQLNFVPTTFIQFGKGYRFLDRMYGDEFNNLPVESDFDRQLKKCIAKELLRMELINIFSGGHFDSDRHGNQMRVHVDKKRQFITIGLYDFGEMSLETPGEDEIQLLVRVLKDIPGEIKKNGSFEQSIDEVISRHVEIATRLKQPVSYLMRVRKAILALQDFQRELTAIEFMQVLDSVASSKQLHPVIQSELKSCILYLNIMRNASYVSGAITSFVYSATTLFGLRKTQPTSEGSGAAAPLPTGKMNL